MSDELWKEIRGCFESDDGSLPDIEINNLSASEVAAIYAMVRGRSRLWSTDSVYWDIAKQSPMPVDSVENAALLVAQGSAEAFHICVADLAVNEVTMPELGVFVFPDCISLDYRMGPQWGRREVDALFGLFREILTMASKAEIRPGEPEGPPYPESFMRVWNAVRSQGVS